jgi:hypothetical protein
VNEFLEAITTETETKFPQQHTNEKTLLQRKKKEKETKEITQNLVFAKEACDTINCQAKEKFVFTKHLSAAKLFKPSIFQEDANRRRLPSVAPDEIIPV